MKKKRKDPRPICDCSAYSFPHKIGGKCKGKAFAEFHFYNVKSECELCNCFNDDRTPTSCDVVDGTESIFEGECYRDAAKYNPSEHLIMSFNFEDDHDAQ
tara:strand:+ start:10308 stop:10607 length:300 start_codon:yes stop_codon:yes gene_type:complete